MNRIKLGKSVRSKSFLCCEADRDGSISDRVNLDGPVSFVTGPFRWVSLTKSVSLVKLWVFGAFFK